MTLRPAGSLIPANLPTALHIMTSYTTRGGKSKRLEVVQANSPAEAAYIAEGSGEPMQLLPRESEGEWRFRRFDEPAHWAFTVKVWRT